MNRPPVYPGGRCGNNSRPHAKIATASPLAGSGARSAPFLARPKSWQVLRGGENCCHGDRLGTQASVQLCEHHNNCNMEVFVQRVLSTHEKTAPQAFCAQRCPWTLHGYQRFSCALAKSEVSTRILTALGDLADLMVLLKH